MVLRPSLKHIRGYPSPPSHVPSTPSFFFPSTRHVTCASKWQMSGAVLASLCQPVCTQHHLVQWSSRDKCARINTISVSTNDICPCLQPHSSSFYSLIGSVTVDMALWWTALHFYVLFLIITFSVV